MKLGTCHVIFLMMLLSACQASDRVSDVQDAALDTQEEASPDRPKPREFVLPASVVPVSDTKPYFGIPVSRLPPRETAVVKSAWHNYQRVLAGKEPECSTTYGLSDGGSTMYDCGAYELMRVKGLAGTQENWGYEYGPSLDFLNGHKVERLRFVTPKELERLEAAP